MTINIIDEYFSASTNRSLNSIDIYDDVLVFGSSNSILLYDYKEYRILGKLDKHENKVNCVKFFDSGNRILSCSGDKTAIIWKKIIKQNQLNESIEQSANQLFNKLNYEVEFILNGHNSSIDIGFSIILNDNNILTITSSNDTVLNIWLNDKLISSKEDKHFTLDIKIIKSNVNLFNDKLIVLLASSDSCVHLFKLDDKFNLIKITKLIGHDEWIRSIDYIFENQDSLMIASGAQDNFIRIWRIKEKELNNLNTDLFISLDGKEYSITLDTVIAGHEDKVHKVKWFNKLNDNENLKLVSVSLDKSLIIWEQPQENTNNIWLEKYRLGEISGNNLGLLSCAISKLNNDLIVNSFNGALHYWNLDSNQIWQRKPIILGHFQAVTDICWDPNNNYLLSASLDATCRLHAKWIINNDQNNTKSIWFELARPQVHGYELNCISSISSTKFISGADEKVLRVYQTTNSFLNSFEKITGIRLKLDDNNQKLSDFAAVPTLGLSNYAVNESNFKQNETIFKPETFVEPPKEESLLSNTLWPEIQKIYGHGYEIYSLSVNRKYQHIASACKSTNHEDAAVCIWDIKNDYQLIQRLLFHKLTITSIKYSPNGNYLVTVSRDRNWAIYKFNEQLNEYQLIQYSKKDELIHSRIIWECCWTPDNKYFMTSSRDKQIIVWCLEDDKVKPCLNEHILKLKESAFSIDISSKLISNQYLIAKGIENGDLIISTWSLDKGWIKLIELTQFHTISIRKLRFNLDGELLATCGDDGFIRIVKAIVN